MLSYTASEINLSAAAAKRSMALCRANDQHRPYHGPAALEEHVTTRPRRAYLAVTYYDSAGHSAAFVVR